MSIGPLSSRRSPLPLFSILAPLAFCACSGPAAMPTPRPVPPPAQWEHDWARGAVFYEVFVRSFADSNGDGIGDLRGLTARLDYLNDGKPGGDDLGVEGIWLMPIFASPSYHGYDTTDYESINPEYGTLEDFEQLCREAHRRGIRVILDLVLNHTSSAHPWFRSAAGSAASPYRRWYVWSRTDPGWKQPWGDGGPTWHRNDRDGWFYYGLFWGGMPDLNFEHRAVRREAKRLSELWLRRGADGFRLDAARHLFASGPGEGQSRDPRTHAFWRELSAGLRATRPQTLLIGEVWSDTQGIAPYYGSTAVIRGGDELPMNFNFPLAGAMVTAIKESDGQGVVETYRAMARSYPPGVADATFLTNHDQVRLATQLQGLPGQLRNAAALLLTLPGTPFLYYGEEVGLHNGGEGGDDRLKRTPFPWSSEEVSGGFSTGTPWQPLAPGWEQAAVSWQSPQPGSLLSRYRKLIAVRAATRALREGALRFLDGGSKAALVFVREVGEEQVLIAHNLSDQRVTTAPLQLGRRRLERLFTDAGGQQVVSNQGIIELTLPRRGSGVWRLGR